MSNWKDSTGAGEALKDEVRSKYQQPPMYNVILLNDDYTPMDFVVEVLCKFFNKDTETATNIMLDIHYKGKGKCGTYTAEVAETKVSQVNDYSFDNQHPLKCSMEKS